METLNNIKLVIWDWNGTLLNDVDICVNSMNLLLKKNNYNIKLTKEKYRKIFTFPVKEYYKNVGFDFEKNPFEIIGHEFIEIYNKLLLQCTLQPFALNVLKYLKKQNIKQILISARENNALIDDVHNQNIFEYFDYIAGISNHYAKGKKELFDQFLANTDIDKKQIVLIGDTVHDLEIAEIFDLNFILYTNGHQDKCHFIKNHLFKIDNLNDLISVIKT